MGVPYPFESSKSKDYEPHTAGVFFFMHLMEPLRLGSMHDNVSRFRGVPDCLRPR